MLPALPGDPVAPPATPITIDSTSPAGGQVLAQLLAVTGTGFGPHSALDAQVITAPGMATSPIGADASVSTGVNQPEVRAGSTRLPLATAGISIPGYVPVAIETVSIPGFKARDGLVPGGYRFPRSSIASAGAAGARPSSQPAGIVPVEADRSRQESRDDHRATSRASSVDDWIDSLSNLEPVEATRQLAAISVCLGAFLAWKSHKSTRMVVRKVKDREPEAPRE
jgi:hypothetical protein